jgi:DNA helicase II / ATP-dependent DNA helicase PcrA
MRQFEAELGKLNPAQRQAVETIEGPVMCVAGPGTGKTQVVSMRVANILEKTQMRPGNILCLTFSTSGATAMRERLRSLIGADAYGVVVNTIHGFANDIILQNPHVFESWAALEQISDVERLRSLNTIIDRMMPDLKIVNKKSPYGRTKDIIDRISMVKREGKMTGDLHAAAAAYREEMEAKSKPGTKAHEKNVLAAEKFEDFVRIFEAYQDMLAQTQRYDYEDMILTVIKVMKDEDWLLSGLQEKYQYILVDEFQDTNGAQYHLIETLTTLPGADTAPNLFVVGDDDQAIYRFQGANLGNILRFRDRFPAAPIIMLNTSYRSTQSILDAASALIAHNEERLVKRIPNLTKDLKAAKGEAGNAPRLVASASDATEPWTVVDLVERRLAAGIPHQEIAILTQTNTELFAYYDVLRAKGIPVLIDGKLDLLNHKFVRQTVNILKSLDAIETNSALASAISSECFRCNPADIGRLYLEARDRQTSIYRLLLDMDDPASDASKIHVRDRDCLLKTRDTLLHLRQQLESRTIVETIEHILKDCGLLTKGESVEPMDFAALQTFFDRIKYRAYEQPQYGYRSLIADLEFYDNPEYAGLRMSYSVPHLVETGIRLMTAHQSKGLEFDTVIIVNFREGHWDKRRNPSSLSMPEDLLFGWDKDQKTFEQHQDERRVAYVAMTRAKNELILSCPRMITTGDKAKNVSPSGFFAEAGELPEEDHALADPGAASILLLEPIRNIDAELAAFLRERLEHFALSVTALNHFLEDPRMFLEQDLLQTPSVMHASLVYGNAVHSALKKWGMSVQRGTPLGVEQFIGEFRNYLVERELTTEKERINLLSLGDDSLPRYYRERLTDNIPFVHKVEYSLRAHLGDIPLKGTIDRLDLDHPDSGRATLVDYKTGRPKTEGEIRDGDYYRQLTFYALLMELARGDLEPQAYVLDFIGEGSDHPVERRFQVMEAEKVELKQVIEEVWKKIQGLDFTPL